MAKTAQQMADKWLQSMKSGATKQAYIDGINGTTVNPMLEAEKQNQKYVDNVAASVASGRRSTALLNTPKAKWSGNAVGKGAGRISDGATTAAPVVSAHFAKWAPIYAQVSQTIAAMPSATPEDMEARAIAAMRMMRAAAGK